MKIPSFKFGVKATRGSSRSHRAEQARLAEDLGFVSLQIDDHFGPQLAPVRALMVGTLVAGVDFAPPLGLPPAVLLDALFFQIGTVKQVARSLREIRERWCAASVAFQPDATEAVGPVVAELAGT